MGTKKEMGMKVLIANDKGGVGKSTLAHYCAVRLMKEGQVPRLVDMDRQPKLHRFFGREAVHSLEFATSAAQQGTSSSGTEAWDPILRWMQAERSVLVDFGAQAWAGFVEWAERTHLQSFVRSEQCIVLIPITSDIESVTGAINVLTTARRILPGARLAVLACDKDGPVEYLRGTSEVEQLIRTAKTVRAASMEIPVLRSAGFAALANRGVRFDRIEAAAASGGIAGIVALASAPPPVLVRAAEEVRTWLLAMDRILLPLLAGSAADRSVSSSTDNAATAQGKPTADRAPARAVVPPLPVAQPAAARSSAGPNGVTPQTFDEEYYLRVNPDVAAAVRRGEFASGFEHFVQHAGAESRLYRLRH